MGQITLQDVSAALTQASDTLLPLTALSNFGAAHHSAESSFPPPKMDLDKANNKEDDGQSVATPGDKPSNSPADPIPGLGGP